MWCVKSAQIGSGRTNFDQIPGAASVAIGGHPRELALAKEKDREDQASQTTVGIEEAMSYWTNHQGFKS